MDAAAQRRDLHALFSPLVRADQPLQFPERGDVGFRSGATDFDACLADVGRSSEGHAMVGVERQEQHAQGARANRLSGAMPMKSSGGRARRVARGTSIQSPSHRLQYLARVLEVAAPHDSLVLGGNPTGGGSRQRIPGRDSPRGRHEPVLRTPPGGAGRPLLSPSEVAHARANAEATTHALDQAHWKSNPPRRPSTSRISPVK